MRKNEKQYNGSLHVNRITDNKTFWRVVQPNFSNKIVATNGVVLRDGGKIISDAEKVADTVKSLSQRNRFNNNGPKIDPCNTSFGNIGNTLKADKDKMISS